MAAMATDTVEHVKVSGEIDGGAITGATEDGREGISISCEFDGGAIELVEASAGDACPTVRLRLRPERCFEACGTFRQWFYFAATGLPVGQQVAFEIVDAGESTYKDWTGYRTCMSYDRVEWSRVEATTFEHGRLRWSHVAEHSIAYYAYFVPYSRERVLDLVGRLQAPRRCTAHILGQTLDGRDLHLLAIGDPAPLVRSRRGCRGPDERKRPRTSPKLALWVQARQHPGETAASWWVEGFAARLLDKDDAVAREVLRRADVFLVPCVNPDGAVRGYLRTNAAGANLNREWAAPSVERSPEVVFIQAAMAAQGIDLLLDVHQDEEKPYSFISRTALGVPSATPEQREVHAEFRAALTRACPDFETPGDVEPVGYPEPAPGKANLAICSAWVTETHQCPSFTIEMPYKGNVNAGTEWAKGWTVEQCRRLGAAALDAILEVIPRLPLARAKV